MSKSTFVCGHAGCGLPVHSMRNGWRHSLGGNTGAIPEHRRHQPVPVYRTDHDRAFAPDTPLPEARELIRQFRETDAEINGGRDERAAGDR